MFLLLAVGSSFYLHNQLENISLLIPTLFCLLFGLYIFKNILSNYDKRSLINSNWKTIGLQAFYSIILCMCLVWGENIAGMLGL